MKKSRLIALLAIILVFSMFFQSCDKFNDLDIVGTWQFVLKISGETILASYTFTGSKESGHVIWDSEDVGTYSVSGDQVNFSIYYYDTNNDYTTESYTGTIDDRYDMHGTFIYTVQGHTPVSGSWAAGR